MRHPFPTPASSSLLTSTPPSPLLPSLLLVPPLRYELIEERLHRGSYPTLRNLPFLARLRLKTLLSLTPEPPTPDLTSFAQAEGIELHHFPVPQPVEGVAVPGSVLCAAVALMVELERLPLYLHCLDGRCVTGVLVGCLRRLQWWSMAGVVDEWARFNDANDDAIGLIEGWKGPLRVPRNLPWWLWEGKHIRHHPTLLIADATLDREGEGSAAERGRRAKTTAGAEQGKGEAEGEEEEGAEGRAQEEPLAAAVIRQWGKRRSWLYYNTAIAHAHDTDAYAHNPRDPEERYTRQLHRSRHSQPSDCARSLPHPIDGRVLTGLCVCRGRQAAWSLALPGVVGAGGLHDDQHIRQLRTA